MKHIHQRWIAAAMSLTLAAGCASPALAAAPAVPISDGRTPTCDEAYYATLDYYGNLTEGSIVKSYVLNGATAVTDYGEYESITNLTNGAMPTQEAKHVAFDFAASEEAPTHFYFQGKTAQPYNDLPWKISVSYKLNGVPTKAEDLADKTGVVEINVDAIPNKNVGSYARHNYTLEAMALFNQDDILSLEAPGAQVQLLGNLRAVLFVAFPGEEGHYSIRVGADKFKFGGMTFLMVPATLSQLDQISKLAQRKEDLENNYEKLSGSLDALLDSLDAVSGSLYSSANGLDALNAARRTVSSGKGDLYAAADQALGDLDAMATALEPLSGEMDAATQTLDSANAILSDMTTSTLALRGDLDTLDRSLRNAQGSKEDVLKAISDVERLQTSLKYSSSGLSNLGSSRLSPINNPLAGQNAAGLSGSLQDVQKAEGVWKSAQGDEAAFANAMLQGSADWNTIKYVYDAYSAQGCSTPEQVADKKQTSIYLEELKNAPAGSSPEDADRYAKAQTAKRSGEIQQEAKAFGTYQQIDLLYKQANGATFENFLCAQLGNEQGEQAFKLYNLNAADPNAVKLIGAESDDINKAVNDLNSGISQVNQVISSVGSVGADTSALLSSLAEVCGDVSKLRPLVEDVDDLTTIALKDSATLQSTLDSVDKLQKLLDAYQPELDRTLGEVRTVSADLAATSADTNTFLHSAENLLQDTGNQLDAATRQSLSSLASALRGTAAALGDGNGVRNAKETINDMVEDTWNDYTGDVSDLLEMDATAEAVSLTDPRNPAPSSVQVLLRTQEIKAAEPEAKTVSAASVVTEKKQTTFLERVQAMFLAMWGAIVGVFCR